MLVYDDSGFGLSMVDSGFLSSLAFRFEQATSSEYAGSSIYKTAFVT